MPRMTAGLTVLAAIALAACGEKGKATITTGSTDVTSPSVSRVRRHYRHVDHEHGGSLHCSGFLCRGGDVVPPRRLRRSGGQVRALHPRQSRQRVGPVHARPLGVEVRPARARAAGVRRRAPARPDAPEESPQLGARAPRDRSARRGAGPGAEGARDRATLGDGLRLLGRAQAELGHFDDAIDAYQRAITIDDQDVWAMNNLGYIYIQQGRSDAALPPLARAVEIRSNVPVFQNNLGMALERAGHLSDAKTAYETALQTAARTRRRRWVWRGSPRGSRAPTRSRWISARCRSSSRTRSRSGGRQRCRRIRRARCRRERTRRGRPRW